MRKIICRHALRRSGRSSLSRAVGGHCGAALAASLTGCMPECALVGHRSPHHWTEFERCPTRAAQREGTSYVRTKDTAQTCHQSRRVWRPWHEA